MVASASGELISEKILNWKVSDEVSLSDHKQIEFEYNAGDIIVESYRDPRKTNWDLYKTNLNNYNFNFEDEIRTVEQLEKASSQIIDSVISSYNASCPV